MTSNKDKIPYTDLKPKINKFFSTKWQQCWNNFFKEINCNGSFCISETWHSLLTAVPRIFLYNRISVSTPWIVFSTQVHNGKPIFSQFVNIFLTKTCSSIDIAYSSVNFKWFALLSHQKLDDRLLFKLGVLFAILNSLKTNIFARSK